MGELLEVTHSKESSLTTDNSVCFRFHANKFPLQIWQDVEYLLRNTAENRSEGYTNTHQEFQIGNGSHYPYGINGDGIFGMFSAADVPPFGNISSWVDGAINVTSESHFPQQIFTGTTYPWQRQPATPARCYDESQVVPTGSPHYPSMESRVHERSEFTFPSPKHPMIQAWVTEKQNEERDALTNDGKRNLVR